MYTLAAEYYTNTDLFAEEKNKIFMNCWIPVAHCSEFKDSQYIIERELVGFSLLLVHDNGVYRGFHNVCRHRAGPLLWSGEAKKAKALRCRYHGWRYGLCGKLTNTPDFGAEVPKDSFPLLVVAVQVWNGMLFVNLAEEPCQFEDFIQTFQHTPPAKIGSFVFQKNL